MIRTAVLTAVVVLCAPVCAHAQLTRDPSLPDPTPRPQVTIGSVVPENATTHIRLRGMGGERAYALRPILPLSTPSQRSASCIGPCSLEIVPGRYQVLVARGPAFVDVGSVDVPLEGGELMVDVHGRRSIGTTLVAGGIAGLVIAVLCSAYGFAEASGPAGFDVGRGGAWLPVGLSAGVIAAAMLGVGGWLAQNYRTRVQPGAGR